MVICITVDVASGAAVLPATFEASGVGDVDSRSVASNELDGDWGLVEIGHIEVCELATGTMVDAVVIFVFVDEAVSVELLLL